MDLLVWLSKSMASNKYLRICASCGGALKKNGKTTAGTIRFRCKECGASTTNRRPSRRQAWWAQSWIAWLLCRTSIEQLHVSMRSFQRHTTRFWDTSPAPVFDGVVRDVLVIDATRIGAAMCHIVAQPPNTRANQHCHRRANVVAWGWAKTESAASWGALMARIPPPRVLVTDAQRGILKAAAQWWPETTIQICTVHAARNLHAKTGKHPDLFALRTARDLATMIPRIHDPRVAAGWIMLVNELNSCLTNFLNERTFHAKPGYKRSWHYTHRKSRSAWRTLARHAHTRDIFTWLDPHLQAACDRPIPATTNDVEGGINAPLKDLIRRHRGLSHARQRVLADWYLASRSDTPPQPKQFLLNPQTHQPRHAHTDTLFGV